MKSTEHGPNPDSPRRNGQQQSKSSKRPGTLSEGGFGRAHPSSSGASLFESANNVDIKGGEFNATAGNQFNFTNCAIKAGGNVLPSEMEGPRKKNQGAKTAVEEEYPKRKNKEDKPKAEKCRSIPIQPSYDIYYRHLAAKGRGSPLWIPEPNKRLGLEGQRKGMQIGDVGIITPRGGFDFLFNICLPADHPINPRELPPDFTPLAIDPTDIQQFPEFKSGSYLSSASIMLSHHDGRSSGLVFESSASEGAILTMPVGSNSEDLGNVRVFRQYAARHAENWYRFALGVRGRAAKNGDIRLVTGYDKTKAWGIATFSNSTTRTNLAFRSKEGQTSYVWDYSGMAEVRAGPDEKETERLQNGDPLQAGELYENQCLFVRSLNVTLQASVWEKLEAHLDGQAENSQYHKIAHVSSSSPAMASHPSQFLNAKLLVLYPTAQISITEDQNWMAMMTKDDTTLPSAEDLYERIMSSFDARKEGETLFLEKKENPVLPKPEDMKGSRGNTNVPHPRSPLLSEAKAGKPGRFSGESEILILLLGNTGVGKSTFINAAAGDNVAQVTHGLTSCKSNVGTFTFRHPENSSLSVIFIEWPGFDQQFLTDREILKRTIEWLKTSYHSDVPFGGIIFLHDISVSRAQPKLDSPVAILERLTRPHPAGHVVMTTVRWEKARYDGLVAQQKEEELREHIWKRILESGGEMRRFINTTDSAWDIVNTLLVKYPLKLGMVREDLDRIQGILSTQVPPETRTFKFRSFFRKLFKSK